MSFLLSLLPSAIQTVLFYARAMRVAPQKLEWIQWRSNAGTLAGGFFRSKAGQLCPRPERGEGTERSFHSMIAVAFGAG